MIDTAATTVPDSSVVLLPATTPLPKPKKTHRKGAGKTPPPIASEQPGDLGDRKVTAAISQPPTPRAAVAPPPPPPPPPPKPPKRHPTLPAPGTVAPVVGETLAYALAPILGSLDREGDPVFTAPGAGAFVAEAAAGMQTVLEALLRARRGNPAEVLLMAAHKLDVLTREHLKTHATSVQLAAKHATIAFLRGLFVLLPMVA